MGPFRAGMILVCLLVPACGGGADRAAGTPPPSDDGPERLPGEVSWTDDVWPILLLRCRFCHTVGSGAEQVPDMVMTDAAALYLRWVRVLSQCTPNFFRVLPGDSEASFVVNKITRISPLCGERMPLEGPPLDESEQRTIRDWIDQGARRN